MGREVTETGTEGKGEKAEWTRTLSEADETSRRVVVGTGIGLDKRELHEVSKAMALDWDLRRLSVLGPVVWNLFLLGIAAVGVLGIATQSRGILRAIGAARGALGGSLPVVASWVAGSILEYGFVIGTAVLVLTPISRVLFRHVQNVVSGVIGGARSVTATLAKTLLLFETDTWKNTNYWHPFTAHHSDRDPLVLFANGDEIPTSGVYTDDPYYRNVFVDSVYVTVDGVTGGRKRELALFERRFRRPRRYAMILLAVIGGGYVLTSHVIGMPMGATMTRIGQASNVLFLLPVAWLIFTDHFNFHSEFYANTAGAAEYDTLLHDDPKQMPFGNRSEERYKDTTLLGNSLAGYGVFYLSEFFRNVVADDRPYNCRIEGTERDKALAAGRDVVKASLPGPGTEDIDPEDDEVTIRIHGVKHLREDREYDRGLRERIQDALVVEDEAENDQKASTGTDEAATDTKPPKRIYMDVTGEPRGIRLPVKRYMSVPSPYTADANRATEDGPGAFPVYFHDSWEEDEVHYLLVGGAEHQQGLVKFIQYLKDSGYENVDFLENTFASEEDFKFSSEYFVSSVLGGPDEEVFRGSNSFLYLRHRHESGHYIHVVVGLSALATKMGCLYWREQFPEFDHTEEDVLYHISYDTEGIDEVSDYYVNAEVSEENGIDPLDFEWDSDPNGSEVLEQKSETRIGCRRVMLTVTDESD